MPFFRVADFELFMSCMYYSVIDTKIPITFQPSQKYFYQVFSANVEKNAFMKAVILNRSSGGTLSQGAGQQCDESGSSADFCFFFVPDRVSPTQTELKPFSLSCSSLVTTLQGLEAYHDVVRDISLVESVARVNFPGSSDSLGVVSISVSNEAVRLGTKRSKGNESGNAKLDQVACDPTELALATTRVNFSIPIFSDKQLIEASLGAERFAIQLSNEKVYVSVHPLSFLSLLSIVASGMSSNPNMTLSFRRDVVAKTADTSDVYSYSLGAQYEDAATGLRIWTELPSHLLETNQWLFWKPSSRWAPCELTLSRSQLGPLLKVLQHYTAGSGAGAGAGGETSITVIVSRMYELVVRVPLLTSDGRKVAVFTYIFVSMLGRDLDTA